jgi:hypothetical protein
VCQPAGFKYFLVLRSPASFIVTLLTSSQEQCNVFAVQEHHVYETETGTVPQQVLQAIRISSAATLEVMGNEL